MKAIVLLLTLFSIHGREALAEGCSHRLGAGLGLVHQDEPSETNVSIGAEYECRLNLLVGVGAFLDHVLSDSGFTEIGLPQLLLHPLGGDFYVAGSPLLQFSTLGTHVGVRLSTRAPIPLEIFTLVPSFAVDFINGRRLYWFGLGFSF